MTTFYTVVSWLVILGYWVLIAGVTLRILMKRRAVPSAMAWLLIIYILPLVGIIGLFVRGRIAFRQTSRRACPRHVAVYRQMVE
ncbi:cardiolipin synthetase [Salmonella enterica subsp. enterica]|nr:cardiolipin synthetase [Salmonella enterica subsp. enterica]